MPPTIRSDSEAGAGLVPRPTSEGLSLGSLGRLPSDIGLGVGGGADVHCVITEDVQQLSDLCPGGGIVASEGQGAAIGGCRRAGQE